MKNLIKGMLIIIAVVLTYIVLIPTLILYYGRNRIYTDISRVQEYDVAIVFGAGLKMDGTPNVMLQERLDAAAQLYYEGRVEKFLLSGDNSLVEYNEPQAMSDYLVFTKNIPLEDVVRDFAGLRTYDTCARAKNIWGIERALLISQGYHLSRAIFTCNRLGVKSTGLSATRHDRPVREVFKRREFLAIHKAVLDIYILHPEYIGGDPEPDFRNQ